MGQFGPITYVRPATRVSISYGLIEGAKMEQNKYSKEAKILIVDDEKSVRDFLEHYLKEKGFKDILSVDNGAAGIDIVKNSDIKLLLLDMRLPGMDGLEVLRKVKEIKKDIGVIMITGYSDESVAKKAIAQGAFDYIMKPFDLQYLEMSVLTKIMMME